MKNTTHMIKRLTIALGIALAAVGASQAQVQNYALSLNANSSVDCGEMPQLTGLDSYTFQFYMNPEEWTQGAVLFQRGEGFKVALGAPTELVFTLGTGSVTATSEVLKAGEWAQITLRHNGNTAIVMVDGTEVGRSTTCPAYDSEGSFVIGGNGYKGRIDEVRIWKGRLKSDFEYFIHTTLTEFVPQYDDLLVYYKMDMNQCEHLVDYCAIDKELEYNNHGILKGGATKVAVTDNAKLPYIINSAYTANERFYDRYIPAEQYRMANDIINLGIHCSADGHLDYATSCDHGTFKGDAKRLESYEGRNTVMSVEGNGYMEVPGKAMSNPEGYSFEGFIYLEEWTDGAYIVRRENADGTEGLAVMLNTFQSDKVTTPTRVIDIRVNGNHWRYPTALTTGKWQHFGFTYNGGNTISTVFSLSIDGNAVSSPRTYYHDGATDGKPVWTDDENVEVGQGLKAKFDQVAIHKTGTSVENFAKHMRNGMTMPGLGKQVESLPMQRVGAYYDFDDPENPCFDLYSQDHWLQIMKSAFDGYRGARFYVTVKTPDGYNDGNLYGLIAKAEFRKNFAEDLAKLSVPYDGVELDLEWVYNWDWYGELAKAIRSKLPEGKLFRVSTHNVTYGFIKSYMGNVDGFTFQQYGPQKVHYIFSKFKNYCESFVNYGYERKKILTSYATTTSMGHDPNTGKATTDIKGVKDGFFDGDYEPQVEVESKEFGGYIYYFTGPTQTYERAKYTREQGFGGIFYWDMGNDVYDPADENGVRKMSKWNLARWSTYAIAPNIDRDIRNVDVMHYGSSGIEAVAAEAEATLSVVCDGTTLRVCVPGKQLDSVEVYNVSGSTVYRSALTDGAADISALQAGIYILSAKAADGCTYQEKCINK